MQTWHASVEELAAHLGTQLYTVVLWTHTHTHTHTHTERHRASYTRERHLRTRCELALSVLLAAYGA